jgi:methylase of polypeptide subunit release factors
MSGPENATFGFADPDDCARARDVFDRAGYTEEGFRTALGTASVLTPTATQLPPWLCRTRGGTPLHTLLRLFFLGVPVDADAARRAVEPMALEAWAAGGLLEVRDGTVAPRVRIITHHGLLLASDMPEQIHTGGARSDYVMGMGKSSMLLAKVTVRRPCRRALDLGTGCGVLALLAAPHSERVWATDKNPRAIAIARFNAGLNGIRNLECVEGDLFEPVADRRFDLIVGSLPFVIAPRARYLFRDSGTRGDEFCRRLVRLAPPLLEGGGFCQLLGNWAHRSGQSWQDALAGWFDGTGCDVLVFGGETQSASAYATSWIQDTESGGPEQFAEHYDRWMAFFDKEGIEAVSYGILTLRRRGGGRNWVCLEQSPDQFGGPCGDHVLRRFQVQDFLEALPDDRALLDTRLRLAPDARLEQQFSLEPTGLAAVAFRLHLLKGLVYATEVDRQVVELVVRCNGQHRLREVFGDIAAARGVGLDALVPGGLVLVRQMLQRGYLLPETAR